MHLWHPSNTRFSILWVISDFEHFILTDFVCGDKTKIGIPLQWSYYIINKGQTKINNYDNNRYNNINIFSIVIRIFLSHRTIYLEMLLVRRTKRNRMRGNIFRTKYLLSFIHLQTNIISVATEKWRRWKREKEKTFNQYCHWLLSFLTTQWKSFYIYSPDMQIEAKEMKLVLWFGKGEQGRKRENNEL